MGVLGAWRSPGTLSSGARRGSGTRFLLLSRSARPELVSSIHKSSGSAEAPPVAPLCPRCPLPRVTVVVLPQLPCATWLRHRHQPQFILGRVRGRVTKRNPHPQPPTMGTTPEKPRDAGEGLGAGAVAVTSCSLSPLAGSHGSKRGAWTHGGARTEGKGGEHHPRAPICPLLQRAGSWPGWGHPSAMEGTRGCRTGVMERGSARARGRDAGGGI